MRARALHAVPLAPTQNSIHPASEAHRQPDKTVPRDSALSIRWSPGVEGQQVAAKAHRCGRGSNPLRQGRPPGERLDSSVGTKALCTVPPWCGEWLWRKRACCRAAAR